MLVCICLILKKDKRKKIMGGSASRITHQKLKYPRHPERDAGQDTSNYSFGKKSNSLSITDYSTSRKKTYTEKKIGPKKKKIAKMIEAGKKKKRNK